MTPIPKKLRFELATDPEYKVCMKSTVPGHECQGGITWEHAVIYAGRQVQEKWAILALCEYAHAVNRFQDGGDLDKRLNLWIALNRASDEALGAYNKVINYVRERSRLNSIYGPYTPPFLVKPQLMCVSC